MNIETTPVAHDSIRFERSLGHPPSRVFAAYVDIEQRVQWTAPSVDEVIVYETHDFQVGGIDRFVCGAKDAPEFEGTTRYEDIVENKRFVFTERLVNGHGLLAMSLVTWTMTPSGKGCALVVTDQVTCVAGQGPIEGSRAGYEGILDNLAAHLDTAR